MRREWDLDEYVGAPTGGLLGFDEAVRLAMRGTRPDHALRTAATVVGAAVATAAVLATAITRRSRS